MLVLFWFTLDKTENTKEKSIAQFIEIYQYYNEFIDNELWCY